MIPARHLSTRLTDGKMPSLGVLSVHLEGGRCRVGCEFCYLGERVDGGPGMPPPELPLLGELLERLAYDEVAVAVSEPGEAALPAVGAIVAAAGRRGRPVAVTTTAEVAEGVPGLLKGVRRVNLSVDPRKGPVSPARVAALAERLHAGGPIEVVLIVSLTTPAFAARLIEDGLLSALVDLPSVDKVALNGLKPPPPWCDRAFWLHALGRLRPLLERALDHKLFLDCYVAARILGLGACPARADLSPAPAGFAFRSCVYQPAAERTVTSADELVAALRDFQPPPTCPFPIP